MVDEQRNSIQEMTNKEMAKLDKEFADKKAELLAKCWKQMLQEAHKIKME